MKNKHFVEVSNICPTTTLTSQSELPRPIKNRPRMYVRCSIMYEKAAFCSLEENSSVAIIVSLKFDKLCFLQEFYLQVNKA